MQATVNCRPSPSVVSINKSTGVGGNALRSRRWLTGFPFTNPLRCQLHQSNGSAIAATGSIEPSVSGTPTASWLQRCSRAIKVAQRALTVVEDDLNSPDMVRVKDINNQLILAREQAATATDNAAAASAKAADLERRLNDAERCAREAREAQLTSNEELAKLRAQLTKQEAKGAGANQEKLPVQAVHVNRTNQCSAQKALIDNSLPCFIAIMYFGAFLVCLSEPLVSYISFAFALCSLSFTSFFGLIHTLEVLKVPNSSQTTAQRTSYTRLFFIPVSFFICWALLSGHIEAIEARGGTTMLLKGLVFCSSVMSMKIVYLVSHMTEIDAIIYGDYGDVAWMCGYFWHSVLVVLVLCVAGLAATCHGACFAWDFIYTHAFVWLMKCGTGGLA